MTLINLASREAGAEVRALFSILEGWRDDEDQNRAATDRTIKLYQNSCDLHLFGWRIDGKLLGLVGVQIEPDQAGEIRHIVVHPSARLQGVARKMIEELTNGFKLRRLRAETDRDSVDFYRRCGFEIESLGEKYPEIERFRCVWRKPA